MGEIISYFSPKNRVIVWFRFPLFLSRIVTVFPIFFINVVENRKNTPLIYKPKKAQGNASLYKIPLTFKGKKIYRCTKKSSNIYSKFSARCTILNLFLHSLPFLSRFYKVFWKSFIKLSHSAVIHNWCSEYIPLILTPKKLQGNALLYSFFSLLKVKN